MWCNEYPASKILPRVVSLRPLNLYFSSMGYFNKTSDFVSLHTRGVDSIVNGCLLQIEPVCGFPCTLVSEFGKSYL